MLFWFGISAFVLAAVTFACAARAAHKAVDYRKSAEQYLLLSEKNCLTAQTKIEEARDFQRTAEHERETAGAILATVRRIEDSLVHPRFAMNRKTGHLRALRAHENPDLIDETEASEPALNCKQCHGRGWTARQSIGGEVIPCQCVKRAS